MNVDQNDLMADSIGNWISNGNVAENMTGVLETNIRPPIIFSSHTFLSNISNNSWHP